MTMLFLERKKSVGKLLSVSAVYALVMTGGYLVSGLLFTGYFKWICAAFICLLVLLSKCLAEKIISRQKTESLRKLFYCLVPLCSVGLFLLLFFAGGGTKKRFAAAVTGYLLVIFFMFCLYRVLSEMLSQKYENELLLQEVKNYSGQMEILLQGEEKIKALRHDMKHHMNELKLLAEKNNNAELEAYLDKMQDFMANPGEIVSSGNMEIDSVLNYMLGQAKQKLNTVNVKVRIPKELEHSFDINVILGNLLENAIEAAEKTEEKSLDVKVWYQKEVLWIQIENSYSGRLQKGLSTTKTEKSAHGIGLNNVKKIVENYHGLMELCPHENTFSVKLILYM